MSADGSGDQHLLNRDAVGELVEVLGAPQVRTVLAKFLADTRHRLATVARAVAERRMGEVCDHLHMLKSTTATFGLLDVARLALEIEAEAKRTTVGDARVALLEATFEKSISQLLAAFPELC